MTKLRGKNFERMSKKQKVKVEKTVKRMSNIRKKDSINLRKNIKDKLEYAQQEKKKGLKAIENFKNNIQINTREIWKLEGVILVLSQLLEEEEK